MILLPLSPPSVNRSLFIKCYLVVKNLTQLAAAERIWGQQNKFLGRNFHGYFLLKEVYFPSNLLHSMEVISSSPTSGKVLSHSVSFLTLCKVYMHA